MASSIWFGCDYVQHDVKWSLSYCLCVCAHIRSFLYVPQFLCPLMSLLLVPYYGYFIWHMEEVITEPVSVLEIMFPSHLIT